MFVVEWRNRHTIIWTESCYSELESDCDRYIMRRLLHGATNEYRIVEKPYPTRGRHCRDVNWKLIEASRVRR